MNRSATFHVHHCGRSRSLPPHLQRPSRGALELTFRRTLALGRSEYTLIYPPKEGSPARVEHHVMGVNSELEEVKQVRSSST